VAGERGPEPRLRGAARELRDDLRTLSTRSALDGARHTLDAVLVTGDGGHAPGTRVRILSRPYRGRTATIVAARWPAAGPPVEYEVQPDGAPVTLAVAPAALTLLQPPQAWPVRSSSGGEVRGQ
jgi:hypothetical protein